MDEPTVEPSPVDPCAGNGDPFGPIPVECAPEAPGWLFPLTMTFLGVAVAVVIVLLIMWFISKRKVAAETPKPAKDWIDLKDFDPRATNRRRRSPKVARKDEGDDT